MVVRSSKMISFVCLIGLTGCLHLPDPPPDYTSSDHIRGTVETTSPLTFDAYEASYALKDNAALALAYVDQGMLLSREACTTWLEAMSEQTNDGRYGEEQFIAVGILATGVLALAGVHSDAFAALALGTSFAMTSIELYQYYKLLGKDAEAITSLVKRSMDTATVYVLNDNPPTTFNAALRSLESFSELCKPATVRNLVLKSLEAAEPKVSPVVDKAGQESHSIFRMEIADALNVEAITDYQLLGLYWLAGNGVQTPDDEEIALKLLGGLRNRYETNKDVNKQKIRVALAKINPVTKKQLQEDIAKQVAALNTAKKEVEELILALKKPNHAEGANGTPEQKSVPTEEEWKTVQPAISSGLLLMRDFKYDASSGNRPIKGTGEVEFNVSKYDPFTAVTDTISYEGTITTNSATSQSFRIELK